MQRILAALLIIAGSAAMIAQPDPLAALRFVIGEWQAIDTPPGESGSFTFTLAAGGHAIVRTNQADYAATPEHPASRHEDLLVIYSETGSLKADYFDSEGHVIRYGVTMRAPNVVVLVSAPNLREPRYRLTYTAGAGGVLLGSFETAPPGSPDAFRPYLSWKARRR